MTFKMGTVTQKHVTLTLTVTTMNTHLAATTVKRQDREQQQRDPVIIVVGIGRLEPIVQNSGVSNAVLSRLRLCSINTSQGEINEDRQNSHARDSGDHRKHFGRCHRKGSPRTPAKNGESAIAYPLR